MTRINIGSGHNPMSRAHNCDIDESCPALTYVCPLESIPVPDETYEEVYSIHSIEHVTIDVARKALKEWYRICKKGGFVHIDTPNILRNIQYYLDPHDKWMEDFVTLTELQRGICSFNGVPNKTLWLNFKCFSSDAKWNVHYWNADPDLLCAMVKDAGFDKAEVIQTNPSLIVRGDKL